jgi:hypothetical protein
MSTLLDTLSKLDTPLEWGESGLALVILFIGFGIGSFLAIRIFKLLSILALVGTLYYVINQITQGFWTDWQELISAALGVGFILSFLVVPFSITAEFEERISKLENKA